MKIKRQSKDKKNYDVIRPHESKREVTRRVINEPIVHKVTKASKVPKADEAPKVPAKVRAKHFGLKWFERLFGSVLFGRLYAVLAVVVLAFTTLLWSLLGAKLQSSNADQLIDPQLFHDRLTMQAADFPGAHTFLLKWPLFWLIRLFHDSASAFIAITVVSVLLTVAALAVVLYKIERRPAVFGTLCMALASVLLLVPAQPYVGGLLPVNMAMLATRNLEYVLFLVALTCIIRARKLRSTQFVLGILCLMVLIASDKLFLGLSVAAATAVLFVYALRQRPQLITVGARWLLAGMLAAAGAFGLLALLNVSGATHIVAGTDSSPYAAVHSVHDLGLGVIYAVSGLLTNFGANPAYDATQLHQIGHQATSRLFAASGFSFVINLLILAGGLFAVWRVLQDSLRKVNRKDKPFDTAHVMALALIATTIAAFAFFVGTTHYYAVDARYLTISLFAVFIAAAAYSRQHVWRRNYVVIVGVAMLLAAFVSVPTAITTYADQRDAYNDITQRNHLISQAISQHPVNTLVGDYWRVIPAKQADPKLNVLPLANCTTPRNTLTSESWQPNLSHHSFGYLLSLDGSLTDFPHCSFDQIAAAYGHPASSLLIAGTYTKPQELLLFYDRGSHPSHDTANSAVATTIAPVNASQLGTTACDGPSVMTIVAHQDDDLLFTNPDLLHDIQQGYCSRTVYVTAGDAGRGQFYWLSREQGSEAAYDEMDGPGQDAWVQKTLQLAPHQYVTVASPRGNSKITLIFMHLPDGNIHGSGFSQSDFQSLNKLADGQIHDIQAVDGQSSYSKDGLTSALATLMHIYSPSEIHTQSPRDASGEFPDHSDHLNVGRFTDQAYRQYEQQQFADQLTVPIRYYIGYPTHGFEPNVFDADLQQKEAAFIAYAHFDGSVCGSMEQCANSATYGSYLSRQYIYDIDNDTINP